MPPQLALLIISTNENLARDLQALIAKHFRSRLAIATSPSEINQKVYAIDPDILVMGQTSLEEVTQNPRLYEIGDDPFFEGRFMIAIGNKPDEIALDSSRYFEVPMDSDQEDFLNAIEKAAEKMGYMTDHGNVEDRLVKRELDVSVEVNDSEFAGRTTGLDLEGCGVRVKSFDPSINEGDECRLALKESDLKGFVPAKGIIQQIDDSWEEGFESYLQIEFTGEGFPSNELARDIIKDLINRQEDESISYSRDED
ncbi:MAG: hypothetical protein ABEK50_02755 [bacterium]